MNPICLFILLLFPLIKVASPLDGKYSFISLKWTKHELELPCSRTLDIISDLMISRMALKIDYIVIPNVTTGGIQMFSPTLIGLGSIKRSCSIDMKFINETKDMAVKACVSVDEVELNSGVKVDLIVGKFSNIVKLTLDNIVIEITATVPWETGGAVVINKVNVVQIKNIKIEARGIISGFDSVINVMMKTKMKEAILKLVSKQLPAVINAKLKQYPI